MSNEKDNDTTPAPPPDSCEEELFTVGQLVARLLKEDQSLPIALGTQLLEQNSDGNKFLRNFLLDPFAVKVITDDDGKDPMVVVLSDVIDEWKDTDVDGHCDCEVCNNCENCDCEDEDETSQEEVLEDNSSPYSSSKKYLN